MTDTRTEGMAVGLAFAILILTAAVVWVLLIMDGRTDSLDSRLDRLERIEHQR